MNKNIKIEYLTDKFKDYTGQEREFILAAVSVPTPIKSSVQFPDFDSLVCEYDDHAHYECGYILPFEKLLLIGMSVRNADDKYDEKIGKRIAVGKAMKLKGKQLILSHAGLANTKMIRALLEQEAEYFKRDPQSYIAGYRNAEKRWKEKQSQQA